MKLLRYFFSLASLAFAANLHSQVYNLRGTDLALSGAGQYTSSITNQGPGLVHQSTSNSVGFLLTFRDHPITKLDVEVNYQYTSLSENFVSATGYFQNTRVQLAMHEFTAAYVVRRHPNETSPFRPLYFVGIGGGALYFNPSILHINTQLRPTGLMDVGADVPTHNPHITYRIQGRALAYRAPNFNHPELSSSRWVATVEPTLGVAFHY